MAKTFRRAEGGDGGMAEAIARRHDDGPISDEMAHALTDHLTAYGRELVDKLLSDTGSADIALGVLAVMTGEVLSMIDPKRRAWAWRNYLEAFDDD